MDSVGDLQLMGGIGKCCCGACEPCLEQAGLTTWSIAESLWGFNFSGAFGTLRNEECYKTSADCQLERNIELDSCSSETAWTDWSILWTCGPCVDCTDPDDPVNLPPCPQDLLGNIDCPPDYPTYSTVETSAREKIVTKFWLSKAVYVAVYAEYISNQIKFRVDVIGYAVVSSTFALAFLQRYKRAEYLCTYNTLISETVYEDNAFPSIGPLEPCLDMFEVAAWASVFWTCGDFEEPTVDPEGCDSLTVVTIADNPCTQLVADACVNVPESWDLTTIRTVECCESLSLCPENAFKAANRFVMYESELFDCDAVPASIELLPQFPFDNLTLEIDLSCVEICDVSNVSHTFPSSLTLTVA